EIEAVDDDHVDQRGQQERDESLQPLIEREQRPVSADVDPVAGQVFQHDGSPPRPFRLRADCMPTRGSRYSAKLTAGLARLSEAPCHLDNGSPAKAGTPVARAARCGPGAGLGSSQLHSEEDLCRAIATCRGTSSMS